MGKDITNHVTVSCSHCGQACDGELIVRDDRNFCCAGCLTVYEILRDNKMLDFYRIDADAGRTVNKAEGEYAWLDVPKLADRSLSYQDGERAHAVLELPAIHCASCLWLLERLPELLEGVQSCRVDFGRKSATVVFRPEVVSLRRVAETLASIGYPPHFSQRREEGDKSSSRSLLYRIGLAGFAFGNIMLLSFPEYFGLAMAGGADAGSGWMGRAMSYLILVLSLPVLAYSGYPFFRGAAQALSARRMTIDVPIVIGMIALFGRSIYEILSATGPGYFDSLAGLLFFLLIGRWFQTYTFNRLNFDRDYHDYFPVAAYRVGADGEPRAIANEDIQVGDTLLVRPGQLVAADGELKGSTSVELDYSFVTGEAEPQTIRPGDRVFAGGRATAQSLQILVSKTPEQSYLLGLWKQEGQGGGAEEQVAPPEWLIRAFTGILLAIAAITFVYWYGKDVSRAFHAATAVLIIACPCALALAAPFAYGTMQRLLAGAGYYFRGPAALRKMGYVTSFVFDKTGTLTEEAQGGSLDFPEGEDAATNAVFRMMAQTSSHPKSLAIARLLSKPSAGTAPVPGEIREHVGKGLSASFEGREYRLGSAAFCGLEEVGPGTFATVNEQLYLSFRTEDYQLRPGGEKLLRELSAVGPTWLLSGDHHPRSQFWERYFNPERLAFEQSPFDKTRRIEQMQAGGEKVLMVGDGLNDAGALRAADVGLAVNEDEARFNPACDGIVKARQLADLPRVMKSVRRLRYVLIFTYILAFAYNLIGLSFAVTGTLSPVIAAVLMPISSITIVIVATLGARLVNFRESSKSN